MIDSKRLIVGENTVGEIQLIACTGECGLWISRHEWWRTVQTLDLVSDQLYTLDRDTNWHASEIY